MILQVKTKLKGHQKPITGLAFSKTLNVLVSSGADAQASGREYNNFMPSCHKVICITNSMFLCLDHSYASGTLRAGKREWPGQYKRRLVTRPPWLAKHKFSSIMIKRIYLLFTKARLVFMTANLNACDW